MCCAAAVDAGGWPGGLSAQSGDWNAAGGGCPELAVWPGVHSALAHSVVSCEEEVGKMLDLHRRVTLTEHL